MVDVCDPIVRCGRNDIVVQGSGAVTKLWYHDLIWYRAVTVGEELSVVVKE